jgi:two-component system OmpR family sensor kinase
VRPDTTPSIRRRLLRSALLYVLLGAAASAAAAAFAVSVVVKSVMDSALEETAQALVVLAEHEQEVAALARGAALPALPHRESLIWQLRASDGSLIARSHDAPREPWPVPLFEGHQESMGLAVYTIAGRNIWLQVAQPLAELRRAQRSAALRAAVAVILCGLLAAGVVAWRIGAELRPVARMARDVEAINPGPAAPDLPRSPRRELEPVYAALEGLLQRLAHKLRSEQAFAAHAAHSLRTPLAGLAAQLEVAHAQAPAEVQPRLAQALDSARRLARVVEALLTMARATESICWRRFEAGTLGTVALGRQVEVDLAALPGAPALAGDPDLLAVAVANLVDNSARHGATHVRLAASVDTAAQSLVVADDGPGVAPERLAALRAALARFDRSGQIDATLGLGLTLAAAVARAHGGRLELDCQPVPTPGFCARLVWPATQSVTAAPA